MDAVPSDGLVVVERVVVVDRFVPSAGLVVVERIVVVNRSIPSDGLAGASRVRTICPRRSLSRGRLLR